MSCPTHFPSLGCGVIFPRAIYIYNYSNKYYFVSNALYLNGLLELSAADKHITNRLKDALSLVDIRVLDHVVVAGAKTVSFAERGLL